VAALDVSGERAQAAAAAVTEIGGRALAIECDVSLEAEYGQALARVAAELGSIEILIQAAQGYGSAADPRRTPVLTPLEERPEENLDWSIRTGVKSYFYGC